MQQPVEMKSITLQSERAQVRLINLGCITQCFRLNHWPKTRSAVLGYANYEDYHQNPNFFGAIIGRVANRIGSAKFTLGDDTYELDANEPPSTLHGGARGFSNQFWNIIRADETSALFHLNSKSGDQGFPFDVSSKVQISLSDTTLTYDMHVEVTGPTPINLAQHNYYNLNGTGIVSDHFLSIPARERLENDRRGLPKNKRSVLNTEYSFLRPVKLDHPAIKTLDFHYCLDRKAGSKITLSNGSDCSLLLETDQLGVQVYAGSKMVETAQPFGTQSHLPFSGLCLEPQGYPNAVNRPDFPSIIVTPERPYTQYLKLTLIEEAFH